MTTTIEKIIEEIGIDRVSGATTLASRGLDVMEQLAVELPPGDDGATAALAGMVRRLVECRPAIGAIGIQAVLAAARARALAAEGASWQKALERAVVKERELSGQAVRAIATLARKEIPPGGIIATCSWSTTVQRVITGLEPKLVRLGEGHRLGDGLRAAGWLAARGVDVEVVPDGALPVVVQDSSCVMIGADQVFADGSVLNRSSSFSAALAAAHFEVPFYVVCQRIKLGGATEADLEEAGDFYGELPEGVTGHAPMFDVTPAALITEVITESGTMTPADAGEVGRSIARLKADILG